MTPGRHEQTKRALGSILNVIRYRAVTTFEEASGRLQMIDEIVVEALGADEKAIGRESKKSHALPRPSVRNEPRTIPANANRGGIGTGSRGIGPRNEKRLNKTNLLSTSSLSTRNVRRKKPGASPVWF
jgi:hypothetical protein